LDLLKSAGIKATFFCTGARVEGAPDVVKRTVAEGHIIANHTYAHSHFTNFYTTRAVVRELARCEEAICAAAGVRPRLFRPPVGLTNPNVAAAVRSLGLDVVGWRAGRFDRRADSCEAVARRVLRSLRGGAIIALHDQGIGAERLVETVRLIIDGVRSKGLRMVPVDELIGRRAYREETGCAGDTH
jgi:peptidoglycan/xylan/chitin deacetylase (PgdA/CDA1 family)